MTIFLYNAFQVWSITAIWLGQGCMTWESVWESIFDRMVIFNHKLFFRKVQIFHSKHFYIIPFDPKEEQSFGLNKSSNLSLVDESEQKMLVFDWSCLSQAITKRTNDWQIRDLIIIANQKATHLVELLWSWYILAWQFSLASHLWFETYIYLTFCYKILHPMWPHPVPRWLSFSTRNKGFYISRSKW